MSKRVLVTGAGGFIGHWLCRRLKAAGHDVVGIDIQKHTWHNDDDYSTFGTCDCRDMDSMIRLFNYERPDWVFALAADMGGAGYVFTGKHDFDILQNNLLINIATAAAARASQPERLLFTSSACVFPQHLQEQPDSPALKEEDAYPANPDSEYGWEKLMAERLYLALAKETGVQVRIARFHNIYGPCFDAETEILTDGGWKFFDELAESDCVATLNPETQLVEYHRPSARQAYQYHGEMYRVDSKLVDLMVTPDHQIYFSKPTSKEFRLGKVSENWTGRLLFKRSGQWDGIDQDHFVLPEARHTDGRLHYKNRERLIPMEEWLTFLGWFLSEGCSYKTPRNYVVCITQYDDEIRRSIMDLIGEMEFSCYANGPNIVITSKQLYNYCIQFGHAGDKFIPREFLELNPRLLKNLFWSLMAGDGDNDRNRYSTKSSRLADDFQELALRLGFCPMVSTSSGMYRISFGSEDPTHIKSEVRSIVDYSGMVYDVTVKNHIILVRRNGKICWSGNCGSWNDGREKLPAAACRKVAEIALGINPTNQVDVWGDGEQRRSFCYIQDCLNQIERLMASDHGEPLNIGTDVSVSVNEMYDTVAAIAGIKIEKVHDLTKPQGVRGRNADLSLMNDVLGWSPQFSLNDGLGITYQWIKGEMKK